MIIICIHHLYINNYFFKPIVYSFFSYTYIKYKIYHTIENPIKIEIF